MPAGGARGHAATGKASTMTRVAAPRRMTDAVRMDSFSLTTTADGRDCGCATVGRARGTAAADMTVGGVTDARCASTRRRQNKCPG